MSSGSGRGRGWLNLAKNADPPKPMGLAQPTMCDPQPSSADGLINLLKQISLDDDGIKFNRKMHYIQEYWMNDCSSEEEVETSFEKVYDACLQDSDFGSKLVMLMASHSFISKEIHKCNLRHQFLKHLQRDFENNNQLQSINPLKFRNCVHMIGEFYSKARLTNGEPYTFLGAPFISCLELLLNTKSLPDLVIFTNQLFLNGLTLSKILPDDLMRLNIKIHSMLVDEPQPTREVKLWLLLSLDAFSVKFGVLSTEICKYYENQLGSTAMANVQKRHDPLMIETLMHRSKVLDSYQSNVNVLQISTSPTEEAQNDVPTSQFGNSVEYNGTQKNVNYSKEVSSKSKEKTGRPILGVGARFIKKGSDDNSSWNNKHSSSGRTYNNKQSSALKNNKGWEHDDRFENDYN